MCLVYCDELVLTVCCCFISENMQFNYLLTIYRPRLRLVRPQNEYFQPKASLHIYSVKTWSAIKDLKDCKMLKLTGHHTF